MLVLPLRKVEICLDLNWYLFWWSHVCLECYSFAWFCGTAVLLKALPPPSCSQERLRCRKETAWLKISEHMVGLSFSPACLCLGPWVAYFQALRESKGLANLKLSSCFNSNLIAVPICILLCFLQLEASLSNSRKDPSLALFLCVPHVT